MDEIGEKIREHVRFIHSHAGCGEVLDELLELLGVVIHLEPDGRTRSDKLSFHYTGLQRCHRGHVNPVGLWNCPTCTDPILKAHREGTSREREMCGPHGVCEFAVVGAANYPQASLGDLALDRDDAPKGSVVEYQIKCQVCHRDGFLLLNHAPPSREREAIHLMVDVLNRCSAVANALNPKDPIPVQTAHRELWAALNAIAEEWPIDDESTADAILAAQESEKPPNSSDSREREAMEAISGFVLLVEAGSMPSREALDRIKKTVDAILAAKEVDDA